MHGTKTREEQGENKVGDGGLENENGVEIRFWTA